MCIKKTTEPTLNYQISMSNGQNSAETDKYFNSCLLTPFSLAQLLTRGVGHSNQKHKFGLVRPNLHNKCKILHHSENSIAEEL